MDHNMRMLLSYFENNNNNDNNWMLMYLVHVELSTKNIKLFIKILQHINNHHWSRCRANCSKSDNVAEEHSDIGVDFGFNSFS